MANEFKTLRCAKATYDFSIHGGAQQNALGLGVIIPNNAIIHSVTGSVQTPWAGAGSTIAINIGSVEVNAATAFDHADYSGIDVHFNTLTLTTESGEINIDIAGANVTGGKYDIYVMYFY